VFLWLSAVWFVCVNPCLILLLLLYHYCETIFGILTLSWMCVGGYHPYRNCPLEGGWHARERGWGLSPTRSGAWLGVGGAAVTAAGVPTWHILTNYENFRLKPFWQTGWLNIELEKWVFGGYCALMMLLFSCSCLRLSCSWLRLFKWFSICWKSSSRSFCACACLRFFSAL